MLGKGFHPHLSPDGKLLLYSVLGRGWNLWSRPLEGEKKPAAFRHTSNLDYWPRVSPDGQYLAYVSDDSGRDEVHLARFPAGEGKWQVSNNGGFWPRWSRGGDRLFYTERDQTLMEVEVATRPAVRLGVPRKLFPRMRSGARLIRGWPDGFDVFPDGKRFVILQRADQQEDRTTITIVQNWFAEFRGKK